MLGEQEKWDKEDFFHMTTSFRKSPFGVHSWYWAGPM